VTALSDEEVDNGQFESVNDLTSLVPNVTEGAEGVPNVRGVSGTGASAGGAALISGARPRVTTSVDGATGSYFGEAYNLESLWDVEQVEFLRGPQSTNQGRAASAGAVVVNTKDPSFDWEAAVRAGYESASNEKLLAGMVSGPLIEDQLAFRLTAQGSLADSYIDYKLDDGFDWPWDPEETQRSEVRGKLLWLPEFLPDFSTQLTVSRRDLEGEYMHRINNPYEDMTLDGEVANQRISDATDTAITWDSDYVLSNSLTAFFSYTHGDVESSFEQAGNTGTTGNTELSMTMDVEEQSNTIDSRLVHDPVNGRLQGVLGFYVFQREQDLSVSNAVAPYIFGDDSVLTTAVYGESTFKATPSLSVIAGGRVERDQQERDVEATIRGNTGRVLTDIDDVLLLPKVGVSYEFAPENTASLTVRKGYTPGAGALDFTDASYYEYDREEVLTYEALTHLTLLEGKIVVDGAAFFNDYSGYQASIDNKVVNVDAAQSYGAELSASWLVAGGLTLSASTGMLSTEITESPNSVTDVEGNEFANAPAFTARLAAKQEFTNGFYVGGDTNYVSEYYTEATNDEEFAAGDYVLLNASAGYEAKSYSVRAFARNLTDETVILTQFARGGVSEARVGTPRTFGLTVDYRF